MKTMKAVPTEKEENEGWTLELRQKLWNLYLQGVSLSRMEREIGKTMHMCECERWKINTQYQCSDPKSTAGFERSKVKGPNRQGAVWSRHDVRILKVAKEASPSVPNARLAELLGRTEDEVKEKLNPRLKMKSFF